MLIRIWSFQTAPENTARFEEFEKRVGIPMVAAQPGCLGVELIRRLSQTGQNEAMADYCMISRWESLEKLQAALASDSWRDEIEIFLAQGFAEGNGSTLVYSPV